jgi:hypothetical protein
MPCIRSGLAEARDRAVDEPRIDRLEGFIIEAVGRESADLEILHEHVRAGGEPLHDLAAGRRREVHGDRLLVAVRAEKISRVRIGARLLVAQKGRSPAACVIAAAGTLDLDDRCAEVAEHLRGPGAGEHAGKIEHHELGERTARGFRYRGAHCAAILPKRRLLWNHGTVADPEGTGTLARRAARRLRRSRMLVGFAALADARAVA